MSELKIAIILGSTRPGRLGKVVADWVLAKAKTRTATSSTSSTSRAAPMS